MERNVCWYVKFNLENDSFLKRYDSEQQAMLEASMFQNSVVFKVIG